MKRLVILIVLLALVGCNVPPHHRRLAVHPHKVKVYKLSNGRVACHGDDGFWYFYMRGLTSSDGTPVVRPGHSYLTPRNNMFPLGGRWVRMPEAPDKKEIEEEQEVEIEETDAGTPEGDQSISEDGGVDASDGADGADGGDGGDGGGDGGE
jgi:hypothetical protein